MTMLVFDPFVEEQLKAERRESGEDRFDEVWDGVQVIASPPDDEHEDLKTALADVLTRAIGSSDLGRVRAGAKVSDRVDGFEHNFRLPDTAVVLPGGAARDCGTHWCGGPDFVAEIVAPYDRSREKLEFYGTIGVRELLLVGRDPWQLELFRLTAARLELVGRRGPGESAVLASGVVPMSFRLASGEPRPRVEVSHHDGVRRWVV